MTGPLFALLAALFVGAVVAATHYVPRALERRRIRDALVSAEQRFRREHPHLIAGYEPPDARHSYIIGSDPALYEPAGPSEAELRAWDADAARRARRVK